MPPPLRQQLPEALQPDVVMDLLRKSNIAVKCGEFSILTETLASLFDFYTQSDLCYIGNNPRSNTEAVRVAMFSEQNQSRFGKREAGIM